MKPGRALGALLVALALAGCGGEGGGGDAGSARLVVTRDRGAEVLVDERVNAGQTLLRALRGIADVDTSYGGRFVDAIEGVRGSAAGRRDWFWFVNGILGDRSAAEYRLHDGDVGWWDYRKWSGDADTLRVAVGAFPEPFLHGFGGTTRPAAVRFGPGLDAAARRVASTIGTTDIAPLGTDVPGASNVFELRSGRLRFVAELRGGDLSPEAPVRFSYAGDVDALLRGAYAWRLAVP